MHLLSSHRSRLATLLAATAATALTAGLATSASAAVPPPAPPPAPCPGRPTPSWSMMENHSYSEIIGSSSAPYINSLATGGAQFTNSFGITHPSEPNYLALFSGSTHGLTSDSCPHTYTTQNLGSELITAGLTFKGYSESMPSDGYTGCTSGAYARKHNPWVNFTSNVPAASNLTFSDFPTSYSSLPTVSFVVPNLNDDMHDGTHRRRRHLAEEQHRRLRHLGQGEQQPADRHLGRGRLAARATRSRRSSTAARSRPARTRRRSPTTACCAPSSRPTGCPMSAPARPPRRSPTPGSNPTRTRTRPPQPATAVESCLQVSSTHRSAHLCS